MPSPPPPPRAGELHLVTLGGLGAIGMNCMVLEQGDDVMLVDCGVTFPHDDLGVDLLHPKFDHVLERADRVRGVFITHGHEDHIGALPYLLDQLDVPIWGPPHALALVRRRIEEHGFDLAKVALREVRPGDRVPVGSFEVEPIRVTHSIADATALAIRTVAGTVIHTGDFKIDAAPGDGELTDEARLRALGDEGVRLLLSDSTSIDSPGWSRSEHDVAAALEREIAAAPHRVIVGMFASNVQRLILIGQIAQRTHRKICLLGRSMWTHVEAARAVSRLAWPSDLVVDPDVAQGMPREQVLALATGTQAEERAALARLALGTHNRMRLAPGDTVLFSSRTIPGNDREVVDMMGNFLRSGVKVVSRFENPGIHASGHGYRDEQRRMMELTRPRAFVPVHGTRHHLERHAAMAREVGIADVLVVEDGEIVRVGETAPLATTGRTPVGRVAVAEGEAIADVVLAERQKLGRQGALSVAFALDRDGRLIGRARVKQVGVLAPYDADVLELAARAVERALRDADDRTRHVEDALIDVARLAARRCVEGEVRVKPTVVVHVVRV